MVSGQLPVHCPTCGTPAATDARFCANCGTPLAAPSAEERKLATILFADVSGSTDLGEQLDPERLRALLSEYFAAMSAVIQQWTGTVEKYIGDAILAVFGVPAAREDDAVRALRAATEMLTRVEELNSGFEQRHGVRLAVRIGVNTGEVLVPSGASRGGQFLVAGDPVNVAARLEQSAEPGTILVGERTWTAARQAFAFGEPTSLTVKGKREPVVARRLGASLALSPEGERGVRFQAPMVGRDRELSTLLGLLDEAIDAEMPRLVVVSGPAGIGKSRMLREFIAGARDRHDGLTVLRGRCLAAGHGITFWALGEVLRAACRISLDEPAETAVEKLRVSVAEILEPLGIRQQEVDETFHALATSASLPVADNPLERQEPEAVAAEMARAWPRLLTGVATRAPALLVIEDLHWADERMVGMLGLIAARTRGRLLVMATARPEFLEGHPGFGGGEDLTVVALRPLTEAQSEHLVAELLGDTDPLRELLADVRQKANGNPFFLEEILQRLIDEGALIRGEDCRWHTTERAQTMRLPDTIHAVLAARIDALPGDEKALLQQAAVVGRMFWPGSLGAIGSDGAAGETLRSLERRGLIAARPTSTIEGESEYMFRHVLIRDVAYAGVPKSRRARAHAETGRWIEELAADRIDEFGELLAYHYAAAATGEDADLAWSESPGDQERLRARAFEALLRSGNAARRRFAVDKALALHGQALALALGDSELGYAHEALGDDQETLFQMDEAVDEYLAAIELGQRVGRDADETGRLVAKLAEATQRPGAFKRPPPHERIRELVEHSLAQSIDERVRAELLIASASIGGIKRPRTSSRAPILYEEREALPRYVAAVEEGMAIAERLDDPLLLYRAYEVIQRLYWDTGDIDRYRTIIEREAKLSERLPSRREKVDVLVSTAFARTQAGRYVEALSAAEQAYELAADLSPHERMHASYALMEAAADHGDWERAVELLPWHVEAATAEPDVTCPSVRGGPPLGATLLVWRGEAVRALQLVPVDETAVRRDTLSDRAVIARYAMLVGRDDVAAVIADQIAADAARLNYPYGYDVFLEVLSMLGRDRQIAEFLPNARRIGEVDRILVPVADRAEATVLLKRGSQTDARRLLEAAVSGFDELSVPFEAARTRELLAGLVEGPEREKLLRAAIEAYERLGAVPFMQHARSTLADIAAPADAPSQIA
jgi:class 3 adenylate cyclase/tetratricopeptide (TPR) repeat protein